MCYSLQHLLFFDIKSHCGACQSVHLVLDLGVDGMPVRKLLLTNHVPECGGGCLLVVVVEVLIIVKDFIWKNPPG